MKCLLLAFAFCITSSLSFTQSTMLNPAFGTNGVVSTPMGTVTSVIRSMAIQVDGKIVTAGSGSNGISNEFALVRYTSTGSVDNSFNGNGKVTTSFGNQSEVFSIAIQIDGKIVAGGYMYNDSTIQFALARYNTDGTLDDNFGNNGKITTAIGNVDDEIKSISIQADGKILAVGYSNASIDNNDYLPQIAVARYNINGSLDSSFDNDGILTTSLGTYDVAYSSAIQTDGKIIVIGTHSSGMNYQFLIVRYNIDGSLDSTFDNDGILTTAISSYYDVAYAVKIDNNGKIIVAGTAALGNNYDSYGFVIARYNADGSLDGTFDNDGKVITSLNSFYDIHASVKIDKDGRILLAAGVTTDGNDHDINLLRYNNNGSADSTFDGDGKLITVMNGNQLIYALELVDSEIFVAGSNDHFFTAAYSSNLSTLPVSLLSFTASLQNNTTKLQWLTTEDGVSSYTIEHSTDGQRFKGIGNVLAMSNQRSQNIYYFIDRLPVAGFNYYRLKIYHENNKYTFSKVVKVRLDNVVAVKIFPNPTTDFLHVEIPSSQKENIFIQLLDNNGRIVDKKILTTEATRISTSVNVSSLAKGNYFLSIRMKGKSQVHKFIKD